MHPDDVATPTRSDHENYELEQQFILRLPTFPAASLKAAIRSGVQNLKERLSIQVDQDLRNGVVRFDGWVLPSKILDLPTIIECHKTLDNKNFYKTSDISQIMICKEEADETHVEQEDSVKRLKDGKDKKFLYPHGITKPLKNVRKRRFRKTLKKKYVDFPEIEKEVKRILRTDNEAKHVRFEIVNIEDENKDSKEKDKASRNNVFDVVKYGELFGDAVSSSDDEDSVRGVADSDEGSRLSATFKDYLKDETEAKGKSSSSLSFSQMFKSENSNLEGSNDMEGMSASFDNEDKKSAAMIEDSSEIDSIRAKLYELDNEITNIQTQRMAQQLELEGIENMALKQRFQAILEDLKGQEALKSQEKEELENILKIKTFSS